MKNRQNSRSTPPETGKNRNFTLLELLIVISVIAILISILLPALNAAKEKARQSSCSGNMKQLGNAALMYTNDFDDCYPSRYYARETAPYISPSIDLESNVEELQKAAKVYICPAPQNSRVNIYKKLVQIDYLIPGNMSKNATGWNSFGDSYIPGTDIENKGFGTYNIKAGKIASPSRRILLTERGNSNTPFNFNATCNINNRMGAPHGAENWVGNLILADGHAASLAMPVSERASGDSSIAGFPLRHSGGGAFPGRFHFDLTLKSPAAGQARSSL